VPAQPDLTLAELQQKLAKTHHLQVSIGRLWQVLRQMGSAAEKSHSTPANATRKPISGGRKTSRQRSAIAPERLIFLDESGLTTPMTRAYARASGGLPKPLRRAIGRS
jgi:hypothetical protein